MLCAWQRMRLYNRLIAEAIPRKHILRVSPRILEKNHPLVVDGTLNALTLETDLAKEITLIGKGAGSTRPQARS